VHTDRVSQLMERARAGGFEALAFVPGPNLFYLTALSFHLSERPVVAFFPVDGSPAVVLPAFEAVKTAQAALELEAFSYTDEEGYTSAFQSACAVLGLADCIVGVEALGMRLLEVRLLERYAPGSRLVPAEEVLAELRMCKDEREVEHMRRAIEVTEAALHTTVGQIRVGMTEREVAALLMVEMLRAGGERMSFPPIVVAGPNTASPHATPGDRPVRRGEPLLIDCGVVVGGYAADITRTFAVGPLKPELAQVYEVVWAANEAGRVAAGPGVFAEEVDRAARAVIEGAGYGEYFTHRTGHGLGLEVHEPPYIVAGNERPLEPGMTFTVEPGIYLPGLGGVRIEDDVLVTYDGAESLTTFTRECLML